MENSTNMQTLLDSLKVWKEGSIDIDHSSAWKKAHNLAEAHYLPAKTFFVAGLKDEDWVWRQNCLQFLGFHYQLESEILEKVRHILLTDPSEDVRMTAASVLGSRSELPDRALIRALEYDASYYVRNAAFEAILELIGIPIKIIKREINRLRAGEIQPNLENIRLLIKSENIEVSEDLLMRPD